MINYQVSASLLRYIVPFTYEGDFDVTCAKIDREGADSVIPGRPSDRGWIRYTPSMVSGESDLYAYIREEFMFDDPEGAQPRRGGSQRGGEAGAQGSALSGGEASARSSSQPGGEADTRSSSSSQPGAPLKPLSDMKSGAQWVHRKIDKGTPLARLVLLPNYKIKTGKGGKNPQIEADAWDGLYENATKIDLTRMGIYLFRNGFGFVWYELDPGRISSDRLMEMQNLIKELNRTTKIRLLKIEKTPVREGAVVCKKVIRNKDGVFHGKDIYLTPFFMGKMLTDTMKFLDVRFLTERKSTYPAMLRAAKRFIEAFPYEKKEYSAQTLARAAADYPTFPDKAVMFSYAYMYNPENPEELGDEMERNFLSFYLTKGYLPVYDCSPKIAEKIVNPFRNAIWYASSEGASYFNWGHAEKQDFYTGGILAKIRNDYFPLFIKTLYQSYSLLLFGRKIQEEIPAEQIERMSDEDYERIARRYEEINLFLTKSMATSVSHIDHQSEFYNYLKDSLRIAEDARSISIGLDAVAALQKEERHRKETLRLAEQSRLEKENEEEEKQRDNAVQRVLEIISYLAIASALIDSYDFISKLAFGEAESWGWMLSRYPTVFIVELLVILAIALIAVRGLYLIRKNTRKKKEEQ